MSQDFFKKDYEIEFTSNPKLILALQRAVEIRKFEIDLYWKRATYFWTFIAVAFAGYGAVHATEVGDNKSEISLFLACLGMVFSFGWYCVNRGSKHWQENWENHVALLEDKILGPLFKVTLTRPRPKGLWGHLDSVLTGPYHFSVSKINQMISIYVSLLWLFFILKAFLDINYEDMIKWYHIALLSMTFLICFFFVAFGKTYKGPHLMVANKRKADIIESTNGE